MTSRLRLAVVFLATAVACVSSKEEIAKSLQESVKGYNEAYRWKSYQLAASYLPADLRLAFVANYEEDDQELHVEGYEILAVHFESENVARVQVRYSYMAIPSVVLQKQISTQHWARVNDQWILEHEDNPIRELDMSKVPDDESFGGPEPAPTMEVEVRDANGEVVGRRSGSAVRTEGE